MSRETQHGPEKTEGGQREVWVADEDVKELLKQILIEIKKANIYLQIITDEEIKGVI